MTAPLVAVVYHSVSGRTKALAERVVRGAEATGARAVLLSVDEEASRAHAVLASADAIVFGSPTYMGSASAAFKAFMDGTSAVWALQGWKDKLAAAFTHSAALSGDKLGTLTQLAVFAAQHGMVWVGLGLPPTYAAPFGGDETNRLGSHLGAMAQSRPGGGVLPESDLRTAEILGERIAAAAQRWTGGMVVEETTNTTRHPTTREWAFPSERPSLPNRINLKELIARPDRFEHHLIVCATIDDVQLEVVTASEPLFFAHINLSDEFAMALPTGDELVDRFPLRTFLSDPSSGEDIGRYNHRVGDVVLHPKGYLHWPGRLRPPYEPFDFPPGMRRTGISLVYCASKTTPTSWCPLPIPAERAGDVKAYREPAPPMALASLRSAPGAIGTIGRTTLSLVELPDEIVLPLGGWVVVIETSAGSPHAPADLYRLDAGQKLDGSGIVRALVLTSTAKGPDPIPASWQTLPAPPFEPIGDETRLPLPISAGSIHFAESADARTVSVAISDGTTEVPRYWLARMLFRVALHGYRLGYVETYGGFFIDDRDEENVLFGIHAGAVRHSASIKRAEIAPLVERIYRSVAPKGYTERLT